MPRARISKQDILKAAARVIHQRGEHALSVRSIAAELGCSTQPLYSQFGSQEQLQQALSGCPLQEGQLQRRLAALPECEMIQDCRTMILQQLQGRKDQVHE